MTDPKSAEDIPVPPQLTHGYPRPQLQRAEWFSLNGAWDFAIAPAGPATSVNDVVWTHVIQVPFAPEAPASGVHDNSLFHACWYRRTVEVPPLRADERLILHFGAVDHRATVWVNGHLIGHHDGGYTPFSFDITDDVSSHASYVLAVLAEDDPGDLAKPRGKQDWQPRPHSIWYPRTTGIWQTVWMERVPKTHITRVRWTPNLERWELGCAVDCEGPIPEGLSLRVRLHAGGQLLADDRYQMLKGDVHRRIALADPGIDDFRNDLLWSPANPQLIHADLALVTESGTVVDEISSYTALRSIAIEGDRFILNGRPYYLRLVLDQGYWPETGQTAPHDDALRHDVALAKAMGFNGVRKHQKVEDPRYLYWADRLGLVVWAEMPSAYRFTHASVLRTSREWMEVIMRDISHPCICAWVPFNESWGVPNLPMNVTERHYVHALYHLTKTLDPTRPVIGNDGWESVATDIIGIHDYDPRPQQLAIRYGADDDRPRLFKQERPAGRALVLQTGQHPDDLPIMLTEFGGIAFSDADATWGYARAGTNDELAERYRALLAAVHAIPLFAGFCYTQFADTYQEANGLLYADRTPKLPLQEIAAATTGMRT